MTRKINGRKREMEPSLSPEINNNNVVSVTITRMKCCLCNRTFASEINLNKHKSRYHDVIHSNHNESVPSIKSMIRLTEKDYEFVPVSFGRETRAHVFNNEFADSISDIPEFRIESTCVIQSAIRKLFLSPEHPENETVRIRELHDTIKPERNIYEIHRDNQWTPVSGDVAMLEMCDRAISNSCSILRIRSVDWKDKYHVAMYAYEKFRERMRSTGMKATWKKKIYEDVHREFVSKFIERHPEYTNQVSHIIPSGTGGTR